MDCQSLENGLWVIGTLIRHPEVSLVQQTPKDGEVALREGQNLSQSPL